MSPPSSANASPATGSVDGDGSADHDRSLPGTDLRRGSAPRRAICRVTSMPGTPVERTTDGIGHTRRSASAQARARSGSQSHAPGSHPRANVRRADKRASLTHAAVLQERARIARELHDSVSQTLYAITLGACRARSLLEQSESTEVKRVIDDVLQLANAGQSELRALLIDIRSDQLTSAGLVAALEDLAADLRTRNGLSVRLSLAEEPDVAAATKDAMVMIVREALHNVVRHSAARCVAIVLECDAGQLILLIGDDGCGFDAATPRPGHFGLQSMRERATAVGGTLALISTVGLGTQLRLSLPVPGDTDG
jgi:signal transduction histidine kinase